ncbi:related to long-chain fatty-acid-CoA ligase [Cephalotrichum gorgonifer]|uniref:Related to long-chain fatty-acid-CoA ligase n=1 Tax=Cephalotrichum gorgonifer TaxID=2041049 RepID=A0AAE8N4R2_9PEZI|nr:related to long-chain fatty-acid-CoA ligase [Cephalotrichum gorgonifer]
MSAILDDYMANWVADLQIQSPLYNKMPFEVHQIIFSFAMAEYCVNPGPHDFRIRHDHDSDDEEKDGKLDYPLPENSTERSTITPSLANGGLWIQPGCIGRYTTDIALLLACRRSYEEARDMVTTDIVLRFRNGAVGKNTPYLRDWEDFWNFCEGIPRGQMDKIVSMHMYSFEENHLPALWLCGEQRQKILRRIEHLRVTFAPPDINTRRTLGPPSVLIINPEAKEIVDFGRGPPPPESPDTDWTPPIHPSAHTWFLQYYQRFPSLKTLTIDFVAREGERDKIAAVVDLASRVWRFPLRPYRGGEFAYYLSAQGNPVELTSWRGPRESSGCSGSCTGQPTERCEFAADRSFQPPLLPHTIPEHFASIVSQHGDRPAVIARAPTTPTNPNASETTLTYEGLDLLSNRLASGLRSLGVKKGDRVAVSLGNGIEFASLTYAVFKLGAILVPLNPGFKAKQVAAALGHLGVEVLIVGAVTDLPYKPGRGRSNEELLRTLVPDLEAAKVESPVASSLKTLVVVDNLSCHPLVSFPLSKYRALTPYSQLLREVSSPIRPDSPLSPSDTINIQFTSGTTSVPKAAMLTHTSILNNGALIADRMGLDPSDRIVVPPPLFHCFGCVLGYMATATTGAAILFPSPAFDPAATLRMVSAHDATGLYGVSTMFIAIMEALAAGVIDPKDMPKDLRKGIAAGSSVPEALMRKLYATLGLQDLVICYGMTETSPVSCMTSPHDPFEKRTSSVGKVMPHTAVKVVDPNDRSRILPIGERGELAAAGYLVMKGYWGDEAKTAEVMIDEPDGRTWMYSGDEASIDADGYVEITGRIKDLIIRGGENIHPLEIENCLFQHPLVGEVSVVGVPDEELGESVAAYIIPAHGVTTCDDGSQEGPMVLTPGSVRDWVREHLSGHLVPKHVFWATVYPKTASGKIQKFKLRDMAKKAISGEA